MPLFFCVYHHLSSEFFILSNIDPDQGTPEARSLVNIKSRWASTLAGLLTSKDEAAFNQTLNSYQKFLDENNFNAIAEIRNTKMQANTIQNNKYKVEINFLYASF